MEHVIVVLYLAVALPAAEGEKIGNRWYYGAVILQWNYFGFSNPAARLEKAEGKLNLN